MHSSSLVFASFSGLSLGAPNVRKVHCILLRSTHNTKAVWLLLLGRLFFLLLKLLFLYEILSCICACFFFAEAQAKQERKTCGKRKHLGCFKIYAKRKCWWIEWRKRRRREEERNSKFDDFFSLHSTCHASLLRSIQVARVIWSSNW